MDAGSQPAFGRGLQKVCAVLRCKLSSKSSSKQQNPVHFTQQLRGCAKGEHAGDGAGARAWGSLGNGRQSKGKAGRRVPVKEQLSLQQQVQVLNQNHQQSCGFLPDLSTREPNYHSVLLIPFEDPAAPPLLMPIRASIKPLPSKGMPLSLFSLQRCG